MKDGTKGVVIDNVDKGSAAAQVGLHKDDIIIGLTGETISAAADRCFRCRGSRSGR
jgi:serine protease DegQ